MRLSLLALVLAASAASAQPEWRAPVAGPSVSLDVLYAVGDNLDIEVTNDRGEIVVVRDNTVGVVSTAVLLSGKVTVGPRWAVRGEVPLAYSSVSGPLPGGDTFDQSDASLGNPYLGVEVRLRPEVVLGAGVRLPLFNDPTDVDQFGWQGGVGADVERFEAYVPDVLTVSASADVTPRLGDSARLRLRLAPAVVSDVSGAENVGGRDATGLLLGYAVLGEVDVRAVTLRGGVTGRPNLTGDRFQVFETTATLAAGATVDVGGVRPGVAVRVPLDRDRLYVAPDAAVALTLDVPFR